MLAQLHQFSRLLTVTMLLASCTAQIGTSEIEDNPDNADTCDPTINPKIFLNRDGGRFYPGPTDSIENTSARLLHETQIQLIPFTDDDWQLITSCVRDVYANYDLDFTDKPPQAGKSHIEIVFAGNSSTDIMGQEGIRAVGGDEMSCDLSMNKVGFAFAHEAKGPIDYCHRAASAIASSFTLSPTNDCGDVTSSISQCNDGENINFELLDEPRDCRRGACPCSDNTQQNSHTYLVSMLETLKTCL